jgi:hypothetical protein
MCGDGPACSTPGTPDDFYCPDLASDRQNCGACGTVCANGVCVGGQCQPCASALCDYADGPYCADFSSDVNNCGSCGTLVRAPGAS